MAAPKKRPSRQNSEELVGVPLDQVEKEVVNKQGISKRVPALHKGFADGRMFMTFIPPPEDTSNEASLDEWRTKMGYLQEDYHWLLSLPHHRFWSQVVYSENLHLSLLSYLSNAPRPFDRAERRQFLTSQDQELLNIIHKLVFFIYLRMATYKESKFFHITPNKFGELIYEHYLFDIPKIMDICALYGTSNGPILQKMLNNIFTSQPQYLQDLEDISATLLSAFNAILIKLGLDDDEGGCSEAGASACSSLKYEPKTTPTLDVADVQFVIDYLEDVSHTLSSFLDAYPPACKILHDQNVELRIASFYAEAFEPLQEEVDKLIDIYPDLQESLSSSRSCLLKLFKDILSYCCIQPILEASSDSEPSLLQSHVSELFRILESCLSKKQFICDYHSNFPVDDDLDILKQTQCDIDEAHTTYIVQSINASFDGTLEIPATSFKPSSQHESKTLQIPNNYENGLSPEVPLELEGACAGPRLQGVELDSLVSLVRNILPNYGEGFVQSCLDYFNYDHEKVIDHLLREDLPDVLKSFEETLPRKQVKEVEEEVEREPEPDLGLLSDRKNVFDGDDFDVFAKKRNVDMSKIHKGKRVENYEEVLESRDHVKASRSLYARYDQVVDGGEDMYEDEYDDTYDSISGWADEPTTPDPLLERRKFTIPRVLRGKDYSEGDESGEEDETKVDPWTEDSKDEIRNVKQQKSNVANGSRNVQGAMSGTKFKDHPGTTQKKAWDNVKGKPKGQGQDEKTQQGRSQKEKHKSVYANHNRRAQADRKRNQGMIRT